MIKDCIICGSPVIVEHESEIVTCQSDVCIHVVENSIGLHYQTGPAQDWRNNLEPEVRKSTYGK